MGNLTHVPSRTSQKGDVLMVRNKDNHPGNFGGPKHFENPKAKDEYAALRPDGSIAPRPRSRMAQSPEHHAYPNEPKI